MDFLKIIRKMTDENGKPTLEQLACATIEDEEFQATVGANYILENQARYGEKGKLAAQSAYETAMNSEAIQKIRQRKYEEKKKEFEKNGVHGFPNYLSDPEISNEIINLTNQSMPMVSLGKLEEIVGGLAQGFEFEVPKELKDYVYKNLYQKVVEHAMGNGENENGEIEFKPEEALDKKEQAAWDMYQFLSNNYTLGVAKAVYDKGYFAEQNQIGAQILEKHGYVIAAENRFANVVEGNFNPPELQQMERAA